jgi:REP element-mobilizing transposase RayT
MPSIKTITPILGGNYYHIFNRGANRQNIFYLPKNYDYFLKLLKNFLDEYVYFLAYSLMPNHFHLIINVRDEIEGTVLSKKENGSLITDETEIGKIVSNQLKRLFITYAMAINKQESRVGNLFDPKYKRLLIENQDYLEYSIFYTHFNPEKHGLSDNFKNYKYSSFKAIEGKKKTSIDRNFVLDLFGGLEEFKNYHNVLHEERTEIILE